LFETIGIAAHAASSGDRKEKKLNLEELTSLASDDDGEESLNDEDLVSGSDDIDDSEKVTKPGLHAKRKAGLDA
jgi:hypothetical protein